MIAHDWKEILYVSDGAGYTTQVRQCAVCSATHVRTGAADGVFVGGAPAESADECPGLPVAPTVTP